MLKQFESIPYSIVEVYSLPLWGWVAAISREPWMTAVVSHLRLCGACCFAWLWAGRWAVGRRAAVTLCLLCLRSLRQLQSFSSTAYRMHARTPCCLVFRLEATPSGSPGPVLYFEDWEEALWGTCVCMVMDDYRQVPRKQISRAKSFSLWPGPRSKFYRNQCFVLFFNLITKLTGCISQSSLCGPAWDGGMFCLLGICISGWKCCISENWVFVIFLTFLYCNKKFS